MYMQYVYNLSFMELMKAIRCVQISCNYLGIHGITEQTTTGSINLANMFKRGELKLPAIDVNNSVTKV